MAILGTLIDRTAIISRVGDGLSGVTTATLAHSLPATTPEEVFITMRSVAAVGGNGNNGIPAVFWLGGNASLTTIGYATPSAASTPTIAFDVTQVVFFSTIR